MPLQNRVTPLGELVADPARGLVYGNRGGLHDGSGRIRRRYNGKRYPGQADQRPRPAARASLSARSNVEANLMSGGTGSAFA